MPLLSYLKALHRALNDELARDGTVCVFGEDIGVGVNNVTSGLLKRLLERYDLVILDTPPVAVFPDALLLSRYCKELIFICKFGAVRLNNVRAALTRLHETGVKVVGVIVNQMPESRFRACGYQGYGAYGQSYYQTYAQTGATQ